MDLCAIVPVYNVEAYLTQCVESLATQNTRGYECEILLVDDCSTDGSGALCEALAARYENVRVVHKPVNEGLGMARNTGLDCSSSTFVTFVDSDDWVEGDMFTALLDAADAQTDIVQCAAILAYDGYRMVPEHTTKIQTYSNLEAMESLFSLQKVSTTAWAKLYRRSLFNTVRFSDTRYNEDTEIMYRLLFACRRFVLLEQPFLVYRQRAASLSKEPIQPNRAAFNVRVCNDQMAFVAQHCPELLAVCHLRCFTKKASLFYRVNLTDADPAWVAQLRQDIRTHYTACKSKLAFKKRLVYWAAKCSTQPYSPLAFTRPFLRRYFQGDSFSPMQAAGPLRREPVH